MYNKYPNGNLVARGPISVFLPRTHEEYKRLLSMIWSTHLFLLSTYLLLHSSHCLFLISLSRIHLSSCWILASIWTGQLLKHSDKSNNTNAVLFINYKFSDSDSSWYYSVGPNTYSFDRTNLVSHKHKRTMNIFFLFD